MQKRIGIVMHRYRISSTRIPYTWRNWVLGIFLYWHQSTIADQYGHCTRFHVILTRRWQWMVMWTFYNCESVGNSIAIRKEWQNQISWQTGTFPFGDWVLESFKTSGGSNRSNRRFLIHYIWPTNQVNILSSWNSLASSDNDKFSWGYVSVGNNCSSILYRQNLDILFRFKNVERSIWTSSLQLFFQEGWRCLST